MALPRAQPARLTTSWVTWVRSVVRWAAPRAPAVGHVGGTQVTAAAVRARDETFRLVAVKVPGLSAACAWIVREAASVDTSSVWNWIDAAVTWALLGTSTPGNRRPTICTFDPVRHQLDVAARQVHRSAGRLLGVVAASGDRGPDGGNGGRTLGEHVDRRRVVRAELPVRGAQPQDVVAGRREGRRRGGGVRVGEGHGFRARSPWTTSPREYCRPADRRRRPCRPPRPTPAG